MQNRIGAARSRVASLIVLGAWLFGAAPVLAATIWVNSFEDDLFPDAFGNLTDINNNPVAAATHCTLRMALAAANLDAPIGGANGCAAGSGADTISFNLPTVLPGTITLANRGMSPAPVVFGGPVVVPPLFAAAAVTIIGPGSNLLTIDGSQARGKRIIAASDANGLTAFAFWMSGVRLVGGTAGPGNGGGCMISTETTSLADVVFESCESPSGGADGGYGGALMVGVDSSNSNNVRPDVTILNSRFTGNRAVRGGSSVRSEGGAIALGGVQSNVDPNNSSATMVGTVTITNTSVTGNTADTRGGLLISDATAVTITGSLFSGNTSTGIAAAGTSGRHGGFLIAGVDTTVTINGNTRVIGNVANQERGGFGIQGVLGGVSIDHVVVAFNSANLGQIGGFDIVAGDCNGTSTMPVTISNIKVVGNSAADLVGGARMICNGPLTLTDSEFTGNEARGYRLVPGDLVGNQFFGNAALQVDTGPSAALARVLFARNNTAEPGGIPVAITGLGSFTADSIRVVDHFMGAGPALYLNADGANRNFLVVNSEISGNSAINFAGLFIEGDGHYVLRNSTVSGNVARTQPGIVSTYVNTATPGGMKIDIQQSTIARNTAPAEEALSAHAQPGLGNNVTITVTNSILGGRAPGYTGASAVSFDAANGVTNVSATNSLLENSAQAPATFCAGAGMKCDVGAVISPIADNGGTAGVRTMALLAGSPAINAGGAVIGGLTTDARGPGFPRIVGGTVDMGAFESDPATTTGCTLDVDGNMTKDATTDGLMIIRALFGMTGTAVTNSALGGTPLRGDWAAIRKYLNANCGTALAP